MLIPNGLTIGAGEAFSSPDLFAPYFAGPSWATWRAVVKGAFAEPLTAEELKAFRKVANRNAPTKRVRELVVAAGRGAGKDSVASALAAYVAISFDPRGRLRPGEKAVVMLLATDRHQAGIAFGYIKALFEEVPALRELVVHMGAESVELINGVVIEVHTNNFRGVRGRSILCVIYDECAFWRDDASANPDIETDRAVDPGLARVPGSLKILISSVHKTQGLLYQKVSSFFGKDDPDVLVVMGGTLDFNPSFDKAIIDRALEQDPERYGAEYLSRWRNDLSSFIDRALLDACVDRKIMVREPAAGIQYVAGCDASGGRGDSFTGAVAHREKDGKIVLDALFERKPPFNPSEVVGELVGVLKAYRIHDVTGDNYGAEWTVEAFQKAGVKYVRSEHDRSGVYMNALPLFTSGRARLLDSQRLITQFAALERRTFPTGRERIDPGPMHDDLANSAAIALTKAAAKTGVMKFSPTFLAWASQPGTSRSVRRSLEMQDGPTNVMTIGQTRL